MLQPSGAEYELGLRWFDEFSFRPEDDPGGARCTVVRDRNPLEVVIQYLTYIACHSSSSVVLDGRHHIITPFDLDRYISFSFFQDLLHSLILLNSPVARTRYFETHTRHACERGRC